MDRVIGAAEFRTTCLRVLEDQQRHREPVTITREGRPIAVLQPVDDREAVAPAR